MKLRYVDDDFRPALVLDDVNNSEFDGVVVLKGLKMPVGEAMGVRSCGSE